MIVLRDGSIALPQFAAASGRTATRRCAWCDGELAPDVRSHARTCSKSCRQKLSRARSVAAKVSRKVLHGKTAKRPLLSSAARDRAGLAEELLSTNGVQLAAPTRYGVVVAGAKGVAIG